MRLGSIVGVTAVLLAGAPVAVAGEWSPPGTLFTMPTGDEKVESVAGYSAAASAAGLYAAWSDGEVVMLARRPAREHVFGAPSTLRTGAGVSYLPKVAVNDRGTAVLVFVNRTSSDEAALMTTMQAPGEPLADPRAVVRSPVVIDFDVDIGQDGTAAAVWRTRSPGSVPYVVKAAVRPPRGTWSEPVAVSTEGLNAAFPDVAVSADGQVAVAWRQPSADGRQLAWSAALDSSGGVEQRQAISAGSGVQRPRLAWEDRGGLFAAWTEEGATQVASAHRPPGGSWGPATRVAAGYGHDVSRDARLLTYVGTDAVPHALDRTTGSDSTLWPASAQNNAPALAAGADTILRSTFEERSRVDAVMRRGGSFGMPETLSTQGTGPVSGAQAPDGSAIALWPEVEALRVSVAAPTGAPEPPVPVGPGGAGPGGEDPGPRIELTLGRPRRVGDRILVRARCSRGCRLRLSARAAAGGRKLRARARSARADRWVALRLRLPARLRRRGGRMRITVGAEAAGHEGVVKRRTVRVRPRASRPGDAERPRDLHLTPPRRAP